MSWLETPVPIVQALNRLNEVIIERYNYMSPATGIEYNPQLEPLSAPLRDNSDVFVKMSNLQGHIVILYRYHFPVKNFGTWGHWRPFDNLSYEEIKPAITNELIEAGIDPAGFWMEGPRLYSDRAFFRACYHLLNNVILFSVEQLWHRDFRVRHLKWNSYAAYDKNSPSVDEIVSGMSGVNSGSAAIGYYKRELECSLSRDFYQNIFDARGRQVCPELQGKWKGRYRTEIWKQLRYPLTSGYQEVVEIYSIPGLKEIAFTGTKSDTTLPWHQDITRNLDYYKTWGDYHYEYAMLRQNDILTEVLLNVENFPPHNYKYLD